MYIIYHSLARKIKRCVHYPFLFNDTSLSATLIDFQLISMSLFLFCFNFYFLSSCGMLRNIPHTVALSQGNSYIILHNAVCTRGRLIIRIFCGHIFRKHMCYIKLTSWTSRGNKSCSYNYPNYLNKKLCSIMWYVTTVSERYKFIIKKVQDKKKISAKFFFRSFNYKFYYRLNYFSFKKIMQIFYFYREQIKITRIRRRLN